MSSSLVVPAEGLAVSRGSSRQGEVDPATLLEREGDYDGLRTYLEAQEPSNRSPRDAARLALAHLRQGALDTAELLLLRLSGQAQPDARVALGLSLLAASRSDPQRRLEHAQVGLEQDPDAWTRPYLLCCAGRAWVELGVPQRGLEAVQEALGCTAPDDLRGRARALYYLQGVHAALEAYPAQERVAREALRLFELLGVEDEGDCLRLDLAYRRFYQGDHPEAFELLAQVLRAFTEGRETRHPTALLLRGEFLLLSGQFEAALHDFTEALALQKRLHQDHLALPLRAYALECRWRLGQLSDAAFGDGVRALRPLNAFDSTVVHFYSGLSQWLSGHTEQAGAAFEQARCGVALLDSFRVRACAFLLEQARQAGNLRPSALEPLLHLLETVGGDSALELDAERLGALYRTLASEGWGGQRLSRLASSGVTPLVLRVQTLGSFGLSLGDERLSVRLAKGRELLVYLCLHGPSSRDTLLEALWGERGAAGRSSYLKQAIRALRDALTPLCRPGAEALTFSEGRYSLNPAWALEVDVLGLLEPVQFPLVQLQAWPTGASWTFLPEVDSAWAEPWRARSAQALLEACLVLGRASADPHDAALHYTRATDLDPLCTEAWQGLIGVWTAAGDLRRARQTRAACRSTFEMELGEVPDFLDLPPAA